MTSPPPVPNNAQLYGGGAVARYGYARSDLGSEAATGCGGSAPQTVYSPTSGLSSPLSDSNRFSAVHIQAIHSMVGQGASPDQVAAMLNSMPAGPSADGGYGQQAQGLSVHGGLGDAAQKLCGYAHDGIECRVVNSLILPSSLFVCVFYSPLH